MRGRRRCRPRQKVITYGFSHLVTRRPTAAVQIADALVAHALEFIRINAGITVKVDDLVRHLHASRRSLETPMTIEAIADTCGFASASHLGTLFKLHFDTTPAAYRRQTRKDSL